MKKTISSVEDLLSEPSFRRWAIGTASEEEAKKWDQWCRRKEINRRHAKEAQAEILGLQPDETDNNVSAENSWNNLVHKLSRNGNRLHRQVRPIVWGYRTAVLFLVIAITTFIVYQFNLNIVDHTEVKEIATKKISTEYGEQKTLSLTDGSQITLNANSSLKYPEKWQQNSKVKVQLTGEAYFSISTDDFSKGSEFVVSTPDGNVNVTGTRFVVETGKDNTQVVLEKGSVNIAQAQNDSGDNNQEMVELKPNQLISFSRFDNETNIRRVNPLIYTSWRNKELILESTPFSMVASRISKTYGVEIKASEKLLNRKLSGSINLKSLDNVMESLAEVMKIEVIKSGRTIYLNNNPKQS
ncbi:FecR family protein [Aliifodinibius salicampi]|uniref:FecR family protein n=1 Tax=Fodinibius salicampi TaxID=1920655 RepID=A0ABT3PVJ0_9BACT|nr:FecR family protein [Fodinibius salicampi]MCW9711882.1 FecR family protein [Fodinibius salicampi]